VAKSGPPDANPTPTPSRKKKSALPRLIETYYDDLKDLAHQNVMYEMGIVRLVGQVIRVSIETMEIVKDLPAAFTDASSAAEGGG
jgi:hypothetical protein